MGFQNQPETPGGCFQSQNVKQSVRGLKYLDQSHQTIQSISFIFSCIVLIHSWDCNAKQERVPQSYLYDNPPSIQHPADTNIISDKFCTYKIGFSGTVNIKIPDYENLDNFDENPSTDEEAMGNIFFTLFCTVGSSM